ncbi:MAG: hypothetical protein QM687_06715 [Ferruginibacter sp.]
MLRLILILLFPLPLSAADRTDTVPRFYTHQMIAEVTAVDTVYLLKDTGNTVNAIPAENFRAVVTHIRIHKMIAGKYTRKTAIIISALNASDHTCTCNFEKGRAYSIYASRAKYSSVAIKEKYRKYFFQLDCYHLPLPADQ